MKLKSLGIKEFLVSRKGRYVLNCEKCGALNLEGSVFCECGSSLLNEGEETTQSKRNKKKGIGGWLVLPLIGLFYSMIVNYYNFFAYIVPMEELYTEVYPFIATTLLYMIIIPIILYVFFKKHIYLPKIIISFLLLDSFLGMYLSEVYNSGTYLGSVLSNFIFLLYFLMSKRVSNTFTKKTLKSTQENIKEKTFGSISLVLVILFYLGIFSLHIYSINIIYQSHNLFLAIVMFFAPVIAEIYTMYLTTKLYGTFLNWYNIIVIVPTVLFYLGAFIIDIISKRKD